jgi:ABC-type branched-subunit amino acid transport system ATPase component
VVALWQRSRRTPDLIARAGLARTFQNIRLFTDLSLVENVLVGMDSRMRSGFWTNLLRLPSFSRERTWTEREALELLEFVGLSERAHEAAGSLPYGHRRRLEIARALASKPAVLLLDEPAAGMNPSEVVDLMELIRRVRDRGVTVILIEHHMKLVMGISDRIVVLQYGKLIGQGTPAEIRADRRCVEAYLGTEGEG